MTIGILASTSAHSCPTSEFAYQCMLHHPLAESHRFVFITDSKVIVFDNQNNFKTVQTFFSIGKRWSNFLFRSLELGRIISKNNIDILVHTNIQTIDYKSARQVVCISEADKLSKAELERLKKYADEIFVHNNHDASVLKKLLLEKKIRVIPYGVSDNINKLSWSEKESTKKELTGGSDYFLLYAQEATAQDLTIALKAFSVFKKWNRTSIKLLLLVSAKNNKAANDTIRNYLFANEVVLLADYTHKAENEWAGSAYGVVFLSTSACLKGKMMHVLSMEVPLLLPQQPDLESMFETSACFYTNDINGLSAKLTLLYKDEVYRNQLVANGASFAAAVSWKSVAERFITAISNGI